MSHDPVYLDLPAPPEQRITEMHVWICTHSDGSEGIMSADMPVAGTIRHMPLMSSKIDLASKLQPIVRNIQRAAMHQADRLVSVRLVTFRRVD